MSKQLLSFFVCSSNVIFAQEAIDITGTYSIHVGGYDWGCATDKVTLTLNNPIDHVDENTFKVVENSETFDYSKGLQELLSKLNQPNVL